MVALKGAGIESFLRKPDPNVKAALIYGPDSGLVDRTGETPGPDPGRGSR